VSASSNQPKSKKKANRSDNNKCGQRWCNFYGWILASVRHPDNIPHYLIAAFTLALAIFACWAWLESQKGTAALEGQLKAMQAEQRPWIKIETSVFGDFNITRGWGTIPVAFKLHNIGKSPAFNIGFIAQHFILADGHTDLFGAQKTLCEQARKSRKQTSAGFLMHAGRYFSPMIELHRVKNMEDSLDLVSHLMI
jgi:hypothetical protein